MNQTNEPTNFAPQLPTSTLAIVSVIAGVLGFTVFPVIATVVALVSGYAARKETRAVPPLVGGDSLATVGIIMGWIQVALTVLGICCFLAYFVFVGGAIIANQ